MWRFARIPWKKICRRKVFAYFNIPEMLTWVVKPHTRPLLVFWMTVTVFLTLTSHLVGLGRIFDYRHDWISAHYSTIARSYAEHGVIALRGVMIQNNSPLGLDPDVYLHWPPLFPIILSATFRMFGESESVAHGLMLLILLANCITLFALIKACCGNDVALGTVCGLLVMPVTVIYGSLVFPLHLAILGMLLALFGFVKATIEANIDKVWAGFGASALVLAVFSSWEALLICPGLLLIATWQRHRSRIRIALLYSIIGIAAFVSVIIIYLFNSRQLFNDLWQTVLFRAGIVSFNPSSFHIHTLTNEKVYSMVDVQPSLVKLLKSFARGMVIFLGPLSMVALGWVLVTGWVSRHSDGDGRIAIVFGGLISPWFLWSIVMSNHAYIHETELFLAAPAVSAAFGLGSVTLINWIDRGSRDSKFTLTRGIALIVVPMLILLPLISEVNDRIMSKSNSTFLTWAIRWSRPENSLVDYAIDIKNATEPEAVVLTPEDSMVPVYYSKRHMIRGVYKDSVAEKAAEQAREIFPGSPVYLALYSDVFREFSQSLQRYPLAIQSKHVTLLKVPRAP